jgi:DNA-binding PadR family transcriptional regulator
VAAGDRRNYFQHGELALVLLALLRQRPMHGYDLLAELERVLPGYRASPGSVYPALAALVDEGLLEAVRERAERQSRRTTFRLRRAGRTALEQRGHALAAFEVRTGARLSGSNSIDAAIDRFRSRVMAVAERLDPEAVTEELDKVAGALERVARKGGIGTHVR